MKHQESSVLVPLVHEQAHKFKMTAPNECSMIKLIAFMQFQSDIISFSQISDLFINILFNKSQLPKFFSIFSHFIIKSQFLVWLLTAGYVPFAKEQFTTRGIGKSTATLGFHIHRLSYWNQTLTAYQYIIMPRMAAGDPPLLYPQVALWRKGLFLIRMIPTAQSQV